MKHKQIIQFTPDVDVCIPCYNSASYIGATIQSVLSQTYKNYVLHIIDNASTDNTLSIIRSFSDHRIRIYKNETNIGMFPNMNRCIDIASLPYFKILCSDDLLYPDCLMTQVQSLKNHKDSVLAYATSAVINEVDNKLFSRRFFTRDMEINGGVIINKILKSGRSLGEPSGLLFRTSILKSYNIRFDNSFASISDLDLLIKILRHGNGYYSTSILYAFRVNIGQGTHRLAHVAIAEHLKIAHNYKEEFLLHHIDLVMLEIKLRIIYFVKKMILFLFTRQQ
jgi:glycosyltransferase involved in cell wall biosynthesis